MRLLRLLLLLPVVTSCCIAHAGTITVQNPSFEIPLLSPGSVPGQTGDQTGTWISYVPYWNTDNAVAGEYLPVASTLPAGATDGEDVLWVNSGSLNQVLAATLENNTTYTLSVDVAQRIDAPTIGYSICLFAGDTGVACDYSSLTPEAGTWLTSSLTYTTGSNDPLAGQPLAIALGSDMVQTDFDNVRLTANPIRQSFETPAAAIPEPGSLMLLIASMGCAIATMRRQ